MSVPILHTTYLTVTNDPAIKMSVLAKKQDDDSGDAVDGASISGTSAAGALVSGASGTSAGPSGSGTSAGAGALVSGTGNVKTATSADVHGGEKRKISKESNETDISEICSASDENDQPRVDYPSVKRKVKPSSALSKQSPAEHPRPHLEQPHSHPVEQSHPPPE